MLPRLIALVLTLAALSGCEWTRFREVELEGTAAPSSPRVAHRERSSKVLRFSVAAVESPRDTYATYSRLFRRMGERLGVQIEFIQQDSYKKVNELLAAGKVDAALVCTGGYLDLERRAPEAVEVLAVPVSDGRLTYRSMIIVPADGAGSIDELRGRRFAFTDELSFSGRAYARRHLRDLGHDPDTFFGSVVFTQNHDRSIRAVAAGLIDGAAVHGGILTHLLTDEPGLASRIRILHESPPFGAMPVVASTAASPELRAQLREVLLELMDDPEAFEALRELGMDGFAKPTPGLYDTARRVIAEPQ